MRKALFVTTIPLTLRSFLLPFAVHFRSLGWQVDAMSNGISHCTKCTDCFNQIWEVSWSRNPFDPKNLKEAPKTIYEVVKQEGYDLVHVHTPVAAFIARYALRNLRAHNHLKVIYTAHGFHFYQGGNPIKCLAFLALEKLAGRWTDYLVVINQEDKDMAHRFRIVPPERVCYMPGIGVDTEWFSPYHTPGIEVRRVREEIDLEDQQPLFLMIAEFIPRKRHRDVITAFARLNHPTAHLAFAGSGVLMDEMKELSRSLKISNRVHFLGFRQDLPALIRASSAVLLPSSQEGLPRSVMESLSMGTPVIGTDIRGTRELLTDGCGLIVKIGDIDGLQRSMAWILNNPDEAKAMGSRARRRMAYFDVKVIIQDHEDLYNEALGMVNAIVAA